MLKFILLFLACFLILSCHNNIRVIDGDSLMLNNKRIRLYGLDAPEYKQTCYNKYYKKYNCGKKAKSALQKLINSHSYCKIKSKDLYQRNIAICYNNKQDINSLIVKEGWAVIYYSKKYQRQQKYAKKHKLGIWQGKFLQPFKYRKQQK